VAGRVDHELLRPRQHDAAQRVDLGQALDLVAEELDPQRAIGLVLREHLHDVAAHAEGAAVEVHVVALVEHVDEVAQQLVAHARAGPARGRRASTRSARARRGRRSRRRSPPTSTSRRVSSEWVVEWRSLSISSLIDESFSMYVSVDGMYASGW
jgi:hypothetical protein